MHCTFVATVQDCSFATIVSKISNEVCQPLQFTSCNSHSSVFRYTRRLGYSDLLLWSPTNEGLSKEIAITTHWFPSIKTLAPIRIYKTNEIVKERIEGRVVLFQDSLSTNSEPITYKQAIKDNHWIEAMTAELKALDTNHTRTIIDKTPGVIPHY